jgi:glucosamine kinase
LPGRLFLGVDGGGTHTRARLRGGDGALLGEGEAGPGNARLGETAYAEVMRACRAALAAAGIAERDFGQVHAGFGLAGTQQPADRAAVLARQHPFASLAVDTDAYAAFLGAFEGADGAILILGTGSCGLVELAGRRATVGGWGAELADDASGYAIGRLAVRRAMLALDGLAAATPLTNEILGVFTGKADNAVAWATKAVPGDYAKFAPAVFAAAERNDPVAVAIVNQAGRDAVMYIERLMALGARQIAMIGGVFPRLLPWLPDRLRSFLVEPKADAMDGAIIMARRALAEGRPQSSG